MKFKPLIVIHESLYSYEEVAPLFQSSTHKGRYHAFIKCNGVVLYITPSNKKAEAAYESSFNGEDVCDSVDPFAYHICLESPEGSNPHASSHIGYTESQYYSLAWLIARTKVNVDRIVGHKDIDTRKQSIDPRNLDLSRVKLDVNKFKPTSYLELGI
jgi:N-acetyl-anhydromuramyl-L-alanine amidase AmpD